MRKRHLLMAFGIFMLFSGASYAGSITIPIPDIPDPPPVPDFMKKSPDVEFVAPPPPPFIRVEVSQPDYWFYDDGRDAWFYYEKGRKRHYVRHHVYKDDGRHFYVNKKKWVKVDRKHAGKKGWAKKHTVKRKVTVKKKKWWRFWDD